MRGTNNQLKFGAVISYLQTGLNIVIGLVYTPVMIKLLGQSEYGLYNTAASTISMISILRLGFNNSYIRYYSRYKKKDDINAINKLNGLFLLLFTVIGIISLGCGIYVTEHLELIFSSGLSDSEYELTKRLMALLVLNLAVSFPMSVFSNIISANERFVYLKGLETVKTAAGPMLTLPLLLMGYGSVGMVMVTFIVSLFVDGCLIFYVLVILKNKFTLGMPEKGIVQDLMVYTFFIAVELIVDQINWNIDKILLARYKGTAMVAVYSVGYSLYSYYQTFSSSLSGVFTPSVHRIITLISDQNEQRKSLTEIFIKVGRIQCMVLMLAATGVLFFGKFFITEIWAGSKYVDSYYVSLLLIFPSTIALIQNIGIEIQRAEFRHQFRSIVYFCMAVANLGMSIVLCKLYGAIGSAVGTAVSLILANGLAMNIYYHLRCNIDILKFWKSIFKLMKALIIPMIAGFIITYFFRTFNQFLYFGLILIYVVIYGVSMWTMGMNDYEKHLVFQVLEKVRKRQ